MDFPFNYAVFNTGTLWISPEGVNDRLSGNNQGLNYFFKCPTNVLLTETLGGHHGPNSPSEVNAVSLHSCAVNDKDILTVVRTTETVGSHQM